jgi:hypothetical protein
MSIQSLQGHRYRDDLTQDGGRRRKRLRTERRMLLSPRSPVTEKRTGSRAIQPLTHNEGYRWERSSGHNSEHSMGLVIEVA